MPGAGAGAGLTARQRGHHAGRGPATVHGAAPGLRGVGDRLGGAGLAPAQPGMAVQTAPQVDEFDGVLLQGLDQRVGHGARVGGAVWNLIEPMLEK